MQKMIYADHGPPEKLPENVRHILHFPSRQIYLSDPKEVFKKLLVDAAKHHAPLIFVEKVWRVIILLYELAQYDKPSGYQWMRKQLLDSLPACTLHYTVVHKKTHMVRHIQGDRFRRKNFPARNYRPVCIETRSNLKDLLKFHAERHEGCYGDRMVEKVKKGDPIDIYFYVDGVQPSTSGTWKMLCQVIKLDCCHMLLNFNTIVYAKDHQLEADELLQGLLSELHANPNVNVKYVIADMPERHRLCGMTNFNGSYGCTVCFSPGEKRDGAPGMVWPHSTTTAHLRDDESFKTLSENTRDTGVVVGGQKIRSPLLSIPGFSIVDGLPIEPMHLFQGITKNFLEQFAKKFLSRKQELELVKRINKMYSNLKLPSDFKRSCNNRDLDLSKWRANEFKQLLALCGMDIGDEYERLGHPRVANVWRRYTWIFRTLAQGDVWYARASHNGVLVKAQIDLLIQEVESLLGPNGCTPNLHALFHMPEKRAKASLGTITAERAEAFYGRNRKWFKEQTMSVGKQIHYNSLLAALDGHACRTPFHFEVDSGNNSMDHIMIDNCRHAYHYLGDDENERFYRVKRLRCQQILPTGINVNLRECGYLQVVGCEEEEALVEKTKIIAKGVLTSNNILHTWTQDLQDL